MEFAYGWIGGACGVLVSHPFDTIRTRQGMTGQPAAQVFRHLVQTEGRMALFSGIMSPCISVGTWKAVMLGTHFQIQKQMQSLRGVTSVEELSMTDVTISACVSGSLASAFCTPFEQIKSLSMIHGNQALAADAGGPRSLADKVRGLLAHEASKLREVLARSSGGPGGASPLASLFRGLPILLARDGPANGWFLGTYEWCRRRLLADGHSPTAAALGAGAVAGPVGWITCYPIEVRGFAALFRQGRVCWHARPPSSLVSP
jgi:hypothetical protein